MTRVNKDTLCQPAKKGLITSPHQPLAYRRLRCHPLLARRYGELATWQSLRTVDVFTRRITINVYVVRLVWNCH